ncbi:hypothetical protein AIOL_001700 [Candidatus Rhodobacter oscarellae]|uniref:Uncharacterized protein n=1 Tax=Candidatus Rhodobacter oscarellae TaxID=1675527 RepID=A0A0J9E1Z5_9RHOB|nr:hypothetical protein [Candidatus Rhodobacter lobularis]KMW56745.1 hypothetical protein AIOL_001700 [Candidatus Rhodobacter lobularis]
MNVNQLINMVMRIVMRQLIGRGINAGINAASGRMSKKRGAVPQDPQAGRGRDEDGRDMRNRSE